MKKCLPILTETTFSSMLRAMRSIGVDTVHGAHDFEQQIEVLGFSELFMKGTSWLMVAGSYPSPTLVMG